MKLIEFVLQFSHIQYVDEMKKIDLESHIDLSISNLNFEVLDKVDRLLF